MRSMSTSLIVLALLAVCAGCATEADPTAPASSAKEITAFSFLASDNAALAVDVVATMDGTDISALVPEGTDLTALVATFTTSGESVRVGATTQVSGVTPNDFSSPVTYAVVAEDGSAQSYTVTVTELTSAKEVTAFSFLASDNVALAVDVIATIDGLTINAVVPDGTDVTALVASFSISGASVRVGATTQVSGVTPNDFSSPVTYTIVAMDGSTQDYAVTVENTSTARTITAFSFLASDNAALGTDVVATIDGTSISASVPEGTDVTALVAAFSTTGASVRVDATTQVSGVTPNDFSSPVTYTVVAEDAFTQDYTVTVTEVSSDKEITEFSFRASDNAALAVDVTATVVGTAISASVPSGTDVTALVAAFSTTGASVRVGATTQVSGVTPNDFSSPVTYTVVAEDASTQDYVVTVTEAASTIWFGDYTIRDADDMAAISGYTEITGYLRIISDLTNLDGLASLTTVGGILMLTNNTALTDVTGLGSVTSVGGHLQIFNNDALTSIDGLDGIATVGTHLEVSGNDLLADLDGLSGLTEVGTYVEIVYNQALQSLGGLGNLATIPTSLIIERNGALTSLAGLEQVTSLGIGDYDYGLEINDNDVLVDLSGLDNLVSITGSLDINHNDVLVSLNGLGSLATVGEGISMSNNALLATLSHLTSLTSVPSLVIGTDYFGGNPSLTTIDMEVLESAGYLFLESNSGLVDLTGLIALESVGILHLYQNPALVTCGFGSAAASPTVVTESVEVYRCGLLENLNGIEATTTMTGWIRLVDNASLNSLAAFDNLTTLGSYLRIGDVDWAGHPDLPDLGFGALTTIGDGLYIEDNDHLSLTSVAFGALQSVGGEIVIYDNANLLDIDGLGNLTTAPSNLIIGDNPDLIDISALGGVTSVGGSLVLDTNTSLQTLLGLDNVAAVGHNLEIRDNYELNHLDNLGSLTSVAAAIEIDRNYDLHDVDGLAGLTDLSGGRLMVMNNSTLANVDGLRNIQTVDGQVWINSNGITRLDLSGLQSVYYDLRISGNTQLTSIDVRALTSIGTDLLIDNTSTLSTVRFDALAWIGQDIYIRNTSGLADLSLLAGFAAAQDALGGDLTLANNTGLMDISALSGFTSMGGNLDITNCDGLTSLDALAGFTSVPGTVWVRDNAQIADLTGLASVASIDGLLMIDNNASLTALGLDALAGLTWDLYVRNNGSLCNDRATDLQTQLMGHGWTRTAYISGNTGACP